LNSREAKQTWRFLIRAWFTEYVLTMSASSTNASAQTLMPLAISTFNNRVTQSGLLVADASFQFVDIQDLVTIDSLLINVK